MKCQILFSRKNWVKSITDLSSAEFAHRVLSVTLRDANSDK